MLSVGNIYSEEQTRTTTDRLAEQLQKTKSVRYSPLTIQNIVSTFSVGIPAGLDLALVAIALNGRLGEWKPKTQNDRGTVNDYLRGVVGTDQPFQSCVSRCRETNTTNSIFRSSQIVNGGAKSIELAQLSAHLIAIKLYKSLGLWTGVYNFKVQNMVTSFGLGYRLNLPYFYYHHKLSCGWDEADFRGLSWRFGGSVFVIFETGNAVLTRGKSFEALDVLYRKAVIILERYKLGEEKMFIEPNLLVTKGTKDKETRNTNKERKEKLQLDTYKRVEADYLHKIRALNEAELRRTNPLAAADVTEQKGRPAKRRRLTNSQRPPLSQSTDSSSVSTNHSNIHPRQTIQRQWKTHIELTAVAPFRPKYQERRTPASFALRKAMARSSQLDEAKDQLKQEKMKMENPPVHVQKSHRKE